MPQGDKDRYTDKQKRQAKHIADGYRKAGKSAPAAKRRAWATVNDQDGGGRKSGSGVGKKRKTSVKDPGRGPAARTGRSTVKKSAAKKAAPKKKRSTAKKAAPKKTAKRSTAKKAAPKKAAPKKTAKRSTAKKVAKRSKA